MKTSLISLFALPRSTDGVSLRHELVAFYNQPPKNPPQMLCVISRRSAALQDKNEHLNSRLTARQFYFWMSGSLSFAALSLISCLFPLMFPAFQQYSNPTSCILLWCGFKTRGPECFDESITSWLFRHLLHSVRGLSALHVHTITKVYPHRLSASTALTSKVEKTSTS